MYGGEAIDVLATLELDCRAYSELIASLGYRIGVVGIANAAGVAVLHGSAARALVLVTDEADADLISGIRGIRAEHPGLRVITIGRDEAVAPWVGVANFVVPRRANAAALVAALQPPPGAAGHAQTLPAPGLRERFRQLTNTEAELLPLLASGSTLRDAARTLAISYKTADNSRTRLFRKLGLRDRVQLARWAIREGIITP